MQDCSFRSFFPSILALCGYEAERVSRAFDEIDLQGQNCQLVFGVPPYVIGWDMNSYISHLSVIDSNNISTEFYYCGASNPLSVYQRIEKIYRGLDEEQKLFILPFGTKPKFVRLSKMPTKKSYS